MTSKTTDGWTTPTSFATFYPVEHVLAINLNKDVARMERVQRQAAEFGIPISRVPAIYGKELDMKYVASFLGKLTAFFQNKPNVVGCALSHMRAWRRIIEEGWECALIVEDDFTFTEGIRKFKKGVTLPTDWSILYHAAVYPLQNMASGNRVAQYSSRVHMQMGVVRLSM
jgi:GR25 family glycosyltransferase involved in LPS biosynthesis